MKKIRLFLLVAMVAVTTVASAQISLGVKGGMNMSNYYGDELSDKNVKIGFNIGLAADYQFAYGHYIQSGLFFTTKGAKYSTETTNAKIEYTINPMYLQLPIHYAYKLEIAPETRIVFHGGPYMAYGVGGKTKVKGNVGNLSGERDGQNVFGDGVGQLKSFDAGLGLGVGAEFGAFLVDLGWDVGLTNLSNSDNGDIKNQNAYLSVGYRF